MLIYTFTYEKSDGKTSNRTLVPFSLPSKFFAGVDISEISTEDQALYISEVEQAKLEYTAKLAELEAKYDLKHRYRQFAPEKMSNVKTEDV